MAILILEYMKRFFEGWHDSESSYSRTVPKDVDGELIKESCSEIIRQIEENSVDIKVRYYTRNLQSYIIRKSLSDDVYTACAKCLHKLWKYSKEKGYIDSDVTFEVFCKSSVAIFNTEKIQTVLHLH